MIQFKVDASLCEQCGLCVIDCVMGIISHDDNGIPTIAPDKEAQCLGCQHCLAICPTGAVSVVGKRPENSRIIGQINTPTYEQMDNLVRSRRSVRRYRDKNVDPALLSQLLESLKYSPTGVNAEELTFHVIDDKAVMRTFTDRLLDLMADPQTQARVVSQYPRYKNMLTRPREVIAAHLFRGAPHVLIVSAPPTASCAEQDVPLALAYFELLAQSAGLGTVWWGLFKFIATAMPEIKTLAGIPDDHVYYAMLFGVPDIQFTRTTQKEDAAQIRRVTL